MASDYNHVGLVGRITRDSELRYTQSGMAILRIGLANGYRRKQGEEWQDETNFFDLTLFGRRAEALVQYLTKGRQIAVAGSLRHERWQDRESGENRSRVSILVNDIQLLAAPRGEEGSSPPPRAAAPPQPAPPPRQRPTPPSPTSQSKPIPSAQDFDDDIPF